MANNIIPPGLICAFGGSTNETPPEGWLLCNGKLYDSKSPIYKALFKTIGTSWGGDGASQFAVPDLQGLFLRGISNNSNQDPGALGRFASRTDLNSAGNSGNAVGSKQPDEFYAHSHPVNPGNSFMNNDSNTNSAQGNGNVNYGRSIISTSSVGGEETRPKNAYVHYIIKI